VLDIGHKIAKAIEHDDSKPQATMLNRELIQEAMEEDVFINFDFAIMSIFATYIFDVSTQIGKTRQIMETSKYWGKDEARLNEGMKGVQRASKQAVALSLFIIIVTAIGISLPTRTLDERMVLILEGYSLLFAAAVMGMLSFVSVLSYSTDAYLGDESLTPCCFESYKYRTLVDGQGCISRYGKHLMRKYPIVWKH
jgi:hypothetical protein